MGDSLSAGVQNFSLLYTEQKNGYASLIAAQANTPLPLPLVPYPGLPNVLELLGPAPDIQQVPGTLTFPRINPTQQAYNISVPGITVAEALVAPSSYSNPSVAAWGDVVLGFPAYAPTGNTPNSQLETALALKPTTVIEWLGNNDALVPALVGQLAGLTPLNQFIVSYDTMLGSLASTGASIVTANIPDVTEVPYFTSVQSIIAGACKPVTTACATSVTTALGVGSGDYLRLSALPLVTGILGRTTAGPLPSSCPSPLAALTPDPIPCVLTAADAATLRATILAYNIVIALESAKYGALMVDIHSLVEQISANGYNIGGGVTLTTSFLGGLFSLDGIHPTNTGYAIVANTFIQAMNGPLKTHLTQVDVPAIAATDPLVF